MKKRKVFYVSSDTRFKNSIELVQIIWLKIKIGHYFIIRMHQSLPSFSWIIVKKKRWDSNRWIAITSNTKLNNFISRKNEHPSFAHSNSPFSHSRLLHTSHGNLSCIENKPDARTSSENLFFVCSRMDGSMQMLRQQNPLENKEKVQTLTTKTLLSRPQAPSHVQGFKMGQNYYSMGNEKKQRKI